MKKRTAILIHAQFLPPGVWEKVMWGDPKNGVLGVIPKGLQMAAEFEAELIYFCSGIPVKGGRRDSPDVNGFIESHLEELSEELCLVWNTARFHQDNDAQTTTQEVARAAIFFRNNPIQRLVTVSVPAHVFRAHKNVLESKMAGNFVGVEVVAIASDGDFPGTSASTTVIVEKPHRSDAIPFNTTLYVEAVIQLLRQGDPEKFKNFLFDWGQILEKQGIPVTWTPLGEM